MTTIRSYNEIPDSDKFRVIEGMREVFFETGHKKNFHDETEMEEYYYRWAGSYLENFQDYFYFATDEDLFVSGYLCGCPNSFEAIKILDFPGLDRFIDLFSKYPAHLHINCHPTKQFQGIGRQLMNRYINDLTNLGIKGVHVLTDPNGSSRGFYHKMGFLYEEMRDGDKASSIRFIGKEILEKAVTNKVLLY